MAEKEDVNEKGHISSCRNYLAGFKILSIFLEIITVNGVDISRGLESLEWFHFSQCLIDPGEIGYFNSSCCY